METETKKETAEYKDVESQIIDSPEGEFRIPEGADIDVSVSETPDKKLHITETVTVTSMSISSAKSAGCSCCS